MSHWKQASIATFFGCSGTENPRTPSVGNKKDYPSSAEGEPSSDSDHPESDSIEPNSSEASKYTDTDQCSSECCNEDLREPYHPDISHLKTKRKQGKRSRSFQSTWFDEHKWLTFCITRKKAYCYYCRTGTKRGLINTSKKGQSAFVSVGFDNWKKAKERFREHEQSQVHREACMKFQSLEQPSVAAMLSNQLLKDQKYRREMLMKELSSLRFLARQGLAIRGHGEEDGNLRQLLKCRAEDVEGLESWLDDHRYLSHDIVNELLEIMAHQLLRGLLHEISQAEWFALIADETRDVSGMEQLAISLRWVSSDYVVGEDVIALAEVEQTDAATLTDVLKDALLRSGFKLSKCRGQAYDGASNMSGHISGVASRILKEEPKAHYVHCVAHSLNLCLQECGLKCGCIRDALGIATELTTLIRASPNRLAQFRHLREQLSPGSPGLKPLCPTRWSVRTGSIDAILKNYTVLHEELIQIGEKSLGEASRKALGCLALMDKFTTYFGLKLSHLVFGATEQLSSTLQYRDINAQEVSMAVSAATRFLQRQRSDSSYDAFFQSTVKEAEAYTQEPTVPRQKRVPRRIDDGAESHQYTSPHDYFRQQYYEVLDMMLNEIDRRFDQPTFMILHDIEKLIVESCNGADSEVKLPSTIDSMYATDLKLDSLKIQLRMLPDLVRTANKDHGMKIRKVTSINTVCELFNTCKFPKTMLSEVDRLLRIYLTVPLTSATAERTFSTLRRLKSYLRSTMSQKRLNHIVLLHTHQQRTDELKLLEIAHDFVIRNSRRKQFFGSFFINFHLAFIPAMSHNFHIIMSKWCV